eukprot:Awhi_evm1s2729
MKSLSKIGKLFYAELFQTAPELKLLFKSPRGNNTQAKMFCTMLDNCVAVLKDLDKLLDLLLDLGYRHASYGVRAEHFPLVGSCLLKTFKKMDKDNWTDEVENSWIVTFSLMTAVMCHCLPSLRTTDTTISTK